MRVWLIVLVVVAALAPGATAATPRWQVDETPFSGNTWAGGADARYAVAGLGLGVVGVFDDRRPAAGFVRRAIPPDCEFGGAVGGGRFAIRCGYLVRLVDLRTGEILTPSLEGLEQADGGPVRLGTRWMFISSWPYHVVRHDYFDIHTNTFGELPDDPSLIADLDSDGLAWSCDPVRRAPFTEPGRDLVVPALEDAVREGDRVVSLRGRYPKLRLTVWRCGQPRPRTIARCGPCPGVQTAGGWVTWRRRDGRIGAHHLRSGRTRIYALPLKRGAFERGDAVHTRHWLIARAMNGRAAVRLARTRLSRPAAPAGRGRGR